MFESKGILFILDGLGDRPVDELDGKTPLEAAQTPVLDRLIQSGLAGLVYHIAPGVPVGTQTGSGLLLGLAPSDVGKLSRGLVQAVGSGFRLQPGDIALRGNFATLDWDDAHTAIIDRRAGRIFEETHSLVEALNKIPPIDEVQVLAKPSTQHRASIVLRGRGLSDAISNTDPGSGKKEIGLLKCHPVNPADASAERTAGVLNAYLKAAHGVLKNHPVNQARKARGLLPANGLITRGAGQATALRNLLNLHRVKTAVISGEATLHGLGRLFGFDVIYQPSFTASVPTDLDGKVSAALNALSDHDLVVLHIKGPDICAHDQNPVGKKAFIELIDAALNPIASAGVVIGVSADHTTDSRVGRHTGDPVPSFISSPAMRKDSVRTFSESSCGAGDLGHLSATAFLCSLLDQMNRISNFRSHEFGYYQ